MEAKTLARADRLRNSLREALPALNREWPADYDRKLEELARLAATTESFTRA
jgi:hypothetical protein